MRFFFLIINFFLGFNNLTCNFLLKSFNINWFLNLLFCLFYCCFLDSLNMLLWWGCRLDCFLLNFSFFEHSIDINLFHQLSILRILCWFFSNILTSCISYYYFSFRNFCDRLQRFINLYMT